VNSRDTEKGASAPAGDPRTDRQLLAIVGAFVLRARRVLAHSLCVDEPSLKTLADGAFYAIRRDGAESVQRRLPNEEILESLAARVRPLTSILGTVAGRSSSGPDRPELLHGQWVW
jgi:hypothetical protein